MVTNHAYLTVDLWRSIHLFVECIYHAWLFSNRRQIAYTLIRQLLRYTLFAKDDSSRHQGWMSLHIQSGHNLRRLLANKLYTLIRQILHELSDQGMLYMFSLPKNKHCPCAEIKLMQTASLRLRFLVIVITKHVNF